MQFYDQSINEQMQHMHAFALEALSHWPGRFNGVKLIKYRENAVFSAYNSKGDRVALRIHRPGYHSDSALLSELCWMRAMSDAGLPVPPVIPDKQGQLFRHVSYGLVPEVRQVDMLGWVAGEPVGGIETPIEADRRDLSDIYHQAGALAARLHRFGQGWRRPNGFTRHAWDANGLAGEKPFWGPFLELEGMSEQDRTLLANSAAMARAHLAELGTDKKVYGLIHADFVPENLLYSSTGLTLIDFDDAGFGWYMFELATALFFHVDQPAYTTIEQALFAGYRSVSYKGVSEELLPLFLFLRSITYLGWVHTRKETETARDMTGYFIERAVNLATRYNRSSDISVPAPSAS